MEEGRIFQARILEWLPFPTPGDLPDSGMEPVSLSSPALAGGFFTTEPPGKPSVQVGPIKLQGPYKREAGGQRGEKVLPSWL